MDQLYLISLGVATFFIVGCGAITGDVGDLLHFEKIISAIFLG